MSKGTSRKALAQIIAMVAALVGVIVYAFTSSTGYLAGRNIELVPILATVLVVVMLAVGIWMGDRLATILYDILVIGSVALLSWSLAIFLLARVPLAADVYFIPVNYPAAESMTLNVSFIGLVAYLVALIALVFQAFTANRDQRALRPVVVD